MEWALIPHLIVLVTGVIEIAFSIMIKVDTTIQKFDS
jgi:hypothetical protein